MEYKIYKEDFDRCKDKGVYLIRNLDNGLLKIGKAKNINRRFKEIKSSFRFCGNAPNLKIEYFIEYDNNSELESYFHNTFENNRIQNEWFDILNSQVVLSDIENFIKLKSDKNIFDIDTDEIELVKLQHKDIHNVSIDYLMDKSFSYKLHLGIFLYGGYKENKSYMVRNLTYINKVLNISRNTIKDKISKYYKELRLDEYLNIEYIENISSNNTITLNKEILLKLCNMDEMAIRLYVLIKSNTKECIFKNQLDILSDIGYSPKSNNNKSELTRNTNELKELGLIQTQIIKTSTTRRMVYKIAI